MVPPLGNGAHYTRSGQLEYFKSTGSIRAKQESLRGSGGPLTRVDTNINSMCCTSDVKWRHRTIAGMLPKLRERLLVHIIAGIPRSCNYTVLFVV